MTARRRSSPSIPHPGLEEELVAAQRRGLIGDGPIERHIAHASAYLVACPEIGSAESLLDLGSGAGLPGLVIAACHSTGRVVLLEGSEVRAEALARSVHRLGLDDRVLVVAERAEIAAHRDELRERFEVVTARSFGPPAVAAECGGAFVAIGGRFVVSDPPGRSERWPDQLDELGLCFEHALSEPVSISVLRKTTPTPSRFPRRVGVPAKHPLF